MSREIRRVPADWKHPTNGFYSNGEIRYVPLFDGSKFQSEVGNWDKENAAWENGVYPSYAEEEDKGRTYTEWNGERPQAKNYMPVWPEEEKTHLMLYETTSEGTPKSPAFKTVEELARWLADNGATTFGYDTASYQTWLDFCRAGSSHGIAFLSGPEGEMSGVEAAAREVANQRPPRGLNADYDGDMVHDLALPPQLPLREITLREFYNLSLSMKNKIRKIRRSLHK